MKYERQFFFKRNSGELTRSRICVNETYDGASANHVIYPASSMITTAVPILLLRGVSAVFHVCDYVLSVRQCRSDRRQPISPFFYYLACILGILLPRSPLCIAELANPIAIAGIMSRWSRMSMAHSSWDYRNAVFGIASKLSWGHGRNVFHDRATVL